MKIKSNKILLEKIFNTLEPAIDSVNPFPSLLGMFLDVSESTATIISSNGDISIKHKVISNSNFSIEKPGIVLVPSYLFRNIIRRLNGEIIIENKNGILYIENEGSIYTINCLDSKEYPQIDFELSDYLKVNLSSKFIKKVIRNVSFSASNNENSNIILSGVNFNLNEGKIISTATDSFRLSQEISEVNSKESFNFTITSKNLRDLFSNLASKEVELLIDENKINIIDENTVYQSKLISMPYLEVSKIIPKNFERKLIIDKKIFNSYLNKASVILNERYNAIDITISNEKIIISSQRKEIGATNIVLSNDFYSYSGNPVKFRLNNKFVKDAINVFDGNIEILMNSNTNPLLVKSESSLDNIQLISPLRMN